MEAINDENKYATLNLDTAKNSDTPEITTTPKTKTVPAEKNIVSDLLKNNLVQGFIMSEILGSPKAKKSRGNSIWNSRF